MTKQVPLDRIQDFLQQLTPQERSRLLLELERLQLCGESIEGSENLLQHLRAEFRGNAHAAERLGNPSRYFFEPLHHVLIDGPAERANAGQISRGSVSVIWEWINQYLLPTMAKEYTKTATHLIASNDTRKAQQAAADFQTKVVKCLEGILTSPDSIAQARDSLAKYTSSRATFDDLIRMLSVLRSKDALLAFEAALPARIEDLDDEPLSKTRQQLDALRAKHEEALPFALAVLTRRLAAPWQLIRLASKIAKSKEAVDLAATRYAIAVSMALDHLDDRRRALCQALKSNRVPIAKDILVDIYDIEYALRVRIDSLEQSDWGKRLDELMKAVATDLDRELHNIPDNLHHVLASRTLHSHDNLAARLTYLAWKGRDFLTGQPAYWKKMLNLGDKATG